MEQARDGTKRFIIISCIFFFCVVAGGGFLVVYVFVPNLSQPWHPIAALVLIGLPWIFWLFTYLYTCIKACSLGRHPNKDQDHRSQMSRRGGRSVATTRKGGGGGATKSTSPGESQVNSPNGQRHVHFGGAAVGNEGGGDSSIASRESEIPLTSSVQS